MTSGGGCLGPRAVAPTAMRPHSCVRTLPAGRSDRGMQGVYCSVIIQLSLVFFIFTAHLKVSNFFGFLHWSFSAPAPRAPLFFSIGCGLRGHL